MLQYQLGAGESALSSVPTISKAGVRPRDRIWRLSGRYVAVM